MWCMIYGVRAYNTHVCRRITCYEWEINTTLTDQQRIRQLETKMYQFRHGFGVVAMGTSLCFMMSVSYFVFHATRKYRHRKRLNLTFDEYVSSEEEEEEDNTIIF